VVSLLNVGACLFVSVYMFCSGCVELFVFCLQRVVVWQSGFRSLYFVCGCYASGMCSEFGSVVLHVGVCVCGFVFVHVCVCVCVCFWVWVCRVCVCVFVACSTFVLTGKHI
jgi:hypothetical protein